MFDQFARIGRYGFGEWYLIAQVSSVGGRILLYGLTLLFAYLLASPRFAHVRRYILLGILGIYLLLLPFNPIDVIAAIVLFFVMFSFYRGDEEDSLTTFGSSRWANDQDVRELDLINETGFWLGRFVPLAKKRGWFASLLRGPGDAQLNASIIRYQGDRHLLTCAPTRSGKGVSAIIPTLLTYEGSAVVIDPKAENAIRTAEARAGMGQRVHLIDPWGLTRAHLSKMQAARFNPLDWIIAESPDATDNAMLLADALVMSNQAAKEPFWDEEARALLAGIILHVATSSSEAENKHLGRVRDILSCPEPVLEDILIDMAESALPLVSSTAARTAGKDPKLRANVLTTAQSHTHWLENPAIRDSLSASDVDFANLKTQKETVYLILPADRLSTYGRWLRVIVQQAITVNARNIAAKPERPVLFLLDEMAALGPLTAVRDAYGLMAGYGMQLWGIVQDLSQLKRLYGDGWETFVGNSGVVQYFGSRDLMTAQYMSHLCGKTTVKNFSLSIVFGGGGSSTRSVSEVQRDLAYPDELMTLRRGSQLVFVENGYPIYAERTPWYETDGLKQLGRTLPSDPGSRDTKYITASKQEPVLTSAPSTPVATS